MATSYSDIVALNDECQKIVADSRTRLDEKRAEIGWLGLLFGAGKNSGYNVASLVTVLCICVGLLCMAWKIFKEKDSPYDVWGQLSPIITLSLGYLFGAKVVK